MNIAVETKFDSYNEKNFKEWTATAAPCKILSITVKRTNSGIGLMYRVQGNGKPKEQNLFVDREDAVKECQRRNNILEERQHYTDMNCSQ